MKLRLFTAAAALALFFALFACEVEFTPVDSPQPPAPVTVTAYETIEVPVYVTVWAVPPASGEDTSAPAEASNAGIVGTSGDLTVAKGSKATITIIGEPNTEYKLTVYLPSGSKSTAKGIEPKTTDASGNAEWSWSVSKNTKAGTGRCVIAYSEASHGEGSVTLVLTITE